MAEGLSSGMGVGYAQVLNPTDTSIIFKRAMELQDTAAKVKAAKEEKAVKRKEATEDEIAKINAKLPTKVYEKHTAEFDKRKAELIKEGAENVEKLSTDPVAKANYELKANQLITDANNSAQYDANLAKIKVNPADYSLGSQEYYNQLQSGFNPDGTINYSIDVNKFVKKPDYETLYGKSPEFQRLTKEQISSNELPTVASGVPGASLKRIGTTREITKDQVKAGTDYIVNTHGTDAEIVTDVAEGIERGLPEYKSVEQYVTVDPKTGLKNYNDAAAKYLASKAPNLAKKTTQISSSPIYDKTYGGRGLDTPDYSSQIDVVTESNPVRFFDKTSQKEDLNHTWYNATKPDGTVVQLLRNDNTGKFHGLASDGNPSDKDVDVNGWKMTPMVADKTVEVETLSGPVRDIKLGVEYTVDEKGRVKDRKLDQGVIVSPERFLIQPYNKKTKSTDIRGVDDKDIEYGFFMRGTEKGGGLVTVPLDDANIETIKSSSKGFVPALWHEYKTNPAYSKKPKSAGTTTTKPASTISKANKPKQVGGKAR